jgi:excinuclease ABC subunit A
MEKIKVVGARVHNLKNISVDIQRDKLTVITGLSGSGKSSLAFDTIFAEGQRRYVESLSSYARQFLGVLEKPDIDYIEGLSPSISIDQKSTTRNRRSTVGTITEIYDYLRLLFARVGTPHCPICNTEVTKQSTEEIFQRIFNEFREKEPVNFSVLASIVSNKKGEHKYQLKQLKKMKVAKVRLDGTEMDLDEAINLELDKTKAHSIEAVIDHIESKISLIDEPEFAKRLEKAVNMALELGNGVLYIHDGLEDKETLFSKHYVCPKDGTSLPEIEPRVFSFNSPQGACPVCQGLGIRLVIDPDLVLPNPRLTIAEGAIRPWSRTTSHSNWYSKVLNQLSKRYQFSLDLPVGDIPKDTLNILLYGEPEDVEERFEGVIPNLERRFQETDSDYLRQEIEKYMVERVCEICQGHRLRPEVLGVTINGKNIVQVTSVSIAETHQFFDDLISKNKLSDGQKQIAGQIIKEISVRLKFLMDVGLSYLSLDRNASTLAGGEAQRIRLATQLGSGLTGVVYILDEPSIGLHPRDHEKLLKTLFTLRDIGNTVIVVEHDEQTMYQADYIIDIGPGAGEAGGKVVSQGTPKEVMADENSLTGLYLSGKKKIEVPKKRRGPGENFLTVKGAAEFNLKNVTAKFPLNRFVCVAGVSGSGKSTLVEDILAKSLAAHFHRAQEIPGKHDSIEGLENIDKVINIDQSPIGRTPRSNPATYTGIFGPIRDLFADTEEARLRNYEAGHFSFNLRGGRCETCRGDGVIKIEMHFLPDVYVTCEECKGKRYNKEALEIHYKSKDIAHILDMTVDEALEFFKDTQQLSEKLAMLSAVGLGYVRLGQPATTLSGGEAQRIKLATELMRHDTGKTLYILDEPTTGLHFEDIKRLLQVIQQLVDKGNTVIVIEHNLDIIKSADWVIDMGPDGGDKGGQIVAEGTPEDIAKSEKSLTGKFLRETIK